MPQRVGRPLLRRRRGQAGHPAQVRDELGRAHLRRQAVVLGHVASERPDLAGRRRRSPARARSPCRWSAEQPEQDLDQRGLPSAVRADQPGHARATATVSSSSAVTAAPNRLVSAVAAITGRSAPCRGSPVRSAVTCTRPAFQWWPASPAATGPGRGTKRYHLVAWRAVLSSPARLILATPAGVARRCSAPPALVARPGRPALVARPGHRAARAGGPREYDLRDMPDRLTTRAALAVLLLLLVIAGVGAAGPAIVTKTAALPVVIGTGCALEAVLAALLLALRWRPRVRQGPAAKLRMLLTGAIVTGLIAIPAGLLLAAVTRLRPLRRLEKRRAIHAARPGRLRLGHRTHATGAALPLQYVLIGLLVVAVIVAAPADLATATPVGVRADSPFRRRIRLTRGPTNWPAPSTPAGSRSENSTTRGRRSSPVTSPWRTRSPRPAPDQRGLAETPDELLPDRAGAAGSWYHPVPAAAHGLVLRGPKFSTHPMPPARRNQAERSLAQLAASLPRRTRRRSRPAPASPERPAMTRGLRARHGRALAGAARLARRHQGDCRDVLLASRSGRNVLLARRAAAGFVVLCCAAVSLVGLRTLISRPSQPEDTQVRHDAPALPSFAGFWRMQTDIASAMASLSAWDNNARPPAAEPARGPAGRAARHQPGRRPAGGQGAFIGDPQTRPAELWFWIDPQRPTPRRGLPGAASRPGCSPP